jgi:hypothetical protein
MEEQAARHIVLVRAIESTDSDKRVLSDDDRTYASRSAYELAHWQASEHNSSVTPELLLQKRAEQVLKKITERTPAFAMTGGAPGWFTVLGGLMPLGAFLIGVLVDRITDPHRVDLLSAPLLGIMLWNLAVYGLLLVGKLLPAKKSWSGSWRCVSFFSWLPPLFSGRFSTRFTTRKLPPTLTAALARFAVEWTRLSASLQAARVSRTLHFGAALFALGAVVSLYVRGLLSRYRAGWESTFLDAEQVHKLLTWLFAPAHYVFGLAGFSIEEVRALNVGASSTLESGARWVHLYAATLLLVVMLPRLTLALAARWQELKLRNNFPLNLDDAYFRKLTDKLGPVVPAVLRVFPYGFSLDESRDAGLTFTAHSMLGDQARVQLHPVIPYGEDLAALPSDQPERDAGVVLTVALFNLTATPEKENHGVFIDHLVHATGGDLAVLVDASGYAQRLGAQAQSQQRLDERTALWHQFCDLHHVTMHVVNLLKPS